MKTKYFEIGKVTRPHGVAGEVKIVAWTDDPDRFHQLKEVTLVSPGGKAERVVKILSVKLLNQFVVLKFAGVDTVEAADTLRDCILKVDRKNAVKLPADSFFVADLIGCKVVNLENEMIGDLTDVFKTGSNDVYVTRPVGGGKDILIPAIRSVVHRIDIEKGIVVVTIPEGLIGDEHAV